MVKVKSSQILLILSRNWWKKLSSVSSCSVRQLVKSVFLFVYLHFQNAVHLTNSRRQYTPGF